MSAGHVRRSHLLQPIGASAPQHVTGVCTATRDRRRGRIAHGHGQGPEGLARTWRTAAVAQLRMRTLTGAPEGLARRGARSAPRARTSTRVHLAPGWPCPRRRGAAEVPPRPWGRAPRRRLRSRAEGGGRRGDVGALRRRGGSALLRQ